LASISAPPSSALPPSGCVFIGDARQHDGQRIEATFGKITERRIA
jgi:hypothetical protein